jgi:ATP-dependent Clp endopeptidase proteolytic subunit ClpP
MKLPILILNEAPSKPGHSIFCRLLNKEDVSKPVEVLIYDTIGKDWDGSGFDAKDFVTQLKGLDENRELTIRVNSRGGIVDEGIAIYNRMREWKGKTVAIVDGSAASIASVIIMGAKEVRMPKSAEILIHEAHAIAYGHAEDMRELANRLDIASDRIANIYAEKTGKTVEEMRNYMRKTTVFNGKEAKEMGLADVLTDETPLYNLSQEDIENFRQPERPPGKPKTETPPAENSGAKTASPMKKKLLALLNKHGIKAGENKALENLTLEELFALAETAISNKTFTQDDYDAAITNKAATPPAPAPANDATIVSLQNAVNALTEANKAEKKGRITAEIDKLIENNQLPGAMRDKAVARALADETILDEYRAMPATPPGTEPLNASIEITAESPREIEKAVLKNFESGKILTPEQARDRGRLRAEIINKNFNRIWPLMNTNTVSSDLKRTVILQQMIRAFAVKVLPLQAFCTVFNGVRLEGTDKVAVPYFPLISTAPTDFNAANGYDTFTDTNSDAKTITVDQRKYLGLSWTSSELARQPFMDVGMGGMLIAEQLATKVVDNILAAVLAATYTNAAYAQPAAAFDSDDVAELKGVADTLNWPGAGRSLVINSAYDVNLLKDQAVKNAMAFGDNGPIREGRILRIGGFDYYPDARVPANGQNLQGFITFKSAMLVAFSPVNPTAEVRQQLSRYEVVVEPTTGAQLEYRMWGDATKDTTREIVESNFGKVAGEATALTRITT